MSAADVFAQAQLVMKVMSPPGGSQQSPATAYAAGSFRSTDSNIWKLLKDVDLLSNAYPRKSKEKEEFLKNLQVIVRNLQDTAATSLRSALEQLAAARPAELRPADENASPPGRLDMLRDAYTKHLDDFFTDAALPEALLAQILAEPLDYDALKAWLNNRLRLALKFDLAAELQPRGFAIPRPQAENLQREVTKSLSEADYFGSQVQKSSPRS